MATRAHRLHSIGDFQQQSRIFVVTGSQCFQVEISQCPGKCIEALPILLYQRVYLPDFFVISRARRSPSVAFRETAAFQKRVRGGRPRPK
jgi:hypothetical protein